MHLRWTCKRHRCREDLTHVPGQDEINYNSKLLSVGKTALWDITWSLEGSYNVEIPVWNSDG